MATTEPSRPGVSEVRTQIGAEREQLARAVDALRADIDDATDVRSKLRAHLPLAAGAAAGIGFVVGGGLGATVRLLTGRRD